MIQKEQNTVRQAAQWFSEHLGPWCHHMVGTEGLVLIQLNFVIELNMVKYG